MSKVVHIALISDIHGNLVALEAVLADLRREGPDHIVCLGDVAASGPQPHEVVQQLRVLNCPVVMGNTDAALLSPQVDKKIEENLRQIADALLGASQQPLQSAEIDPDFRRILEIDLWCAKQLSQADLDYLRTFKPTIEMPLDNGTTLLCFHGSPNSNTDIIVATTPEEDLERLLTGFRATVMAGGHTHTQMIRRYKDMLLINPGSVGLPYERMPNGIRNPPWAEYAIIRWENECLGIEQRRVSLNVDAVKRAALKSGMPHADWWAKDWQ